MIPSNMDPPEPRPPLTEEQQAMRDRIVRHWLEHPEVLDELMQSLQEEIVDWP